MISTLIAGFLAASNNDQESFLKFISDILQFCLIEFNRYISYYWRLLIISCHGRDTEGGGAETERDCMRTPSPLHGRSTMALHGDHDLTFLASDVRDVW